MKLMRKRAERAERMAIGMGFLLLKLSDRFGGEMGDGMFQQVQQAIRDYDSLGRSIRQREATAAAQNKEPS